MVSTTKYIRSKAAGNKTAEKEATTEVIEVTVVVGVLLAHLTVNSSKLLQVE